MQIKDQATAVEAALNLDRPVVEPKPGEPPTPRSQSTTSKLFPEFTTDDGGIINRPVRPFEDKDKALPPVAATPAPATTTPAPAAPAPTPPGYLDLSKMPDGTMVRIKVDGVETDVLAKEVLKNVQLERHLTQKSQELARERASLEAERAALRQAAPAPAAPKGPETPPPPAVPAKSPEAERIARLEADLATMRAIVAPQQFQAGLNRIAEKAKAELGATDFLEYAPKIQAFVDAEVAKPEVAANAAVMQMLDSQAFWYGKYQEMKLKDVLSGVKPAAPVLTPASIIQPTSPVVAPAGTHVVLNRNSEPVVVPIVEGSTGVPSRTSPDQDWQARYQAAFETASKTGRTEDWQAVFRLKREVPGN